MGEDQMFSSSVYDDPMIQQMNIIRDYIQQARSANRFDEVSMLENNLKELQVEFRRQKQAESEANTSNDNPADGGRNERRPPPAPAATSSLRRPFQNPVFDENKIKLGNGDVSNPFGDDSDTDDYDASGKNPFAE